MGYSGLILIAHTGDTPLDELACVRDLFVAVTDKLCADGWRLGYLGPVDDTSPGDLAGELAQETAAPAIALATFDTHGAFGVAVDPAGGSVEFHLNPDSLRADEGFEPLDGQAAAGLLAWAEKAGLDADPARLAAALEHSPGPFGVGILDLADALGVHELD